jgi:hypothetical protein
MMSRLPEATYRHMLARKIPNQADSTRQLTRRRDGRDSGVFDSRYCRATE